MTKGTSVFMKKAISADLTLIGCFLGGTRHTAVLLLLAAATFGGATGCSGTSPDAGTPPGTKMCTQIGCGPGLKIVLPALPNESQGPITFRYCLDGRCLEQSYSSVGEVPDFVEVEATEPTVSLSVELRDSVRAVGRFPETKLTLKEARPNGPDCPPVCYQGEARVPYIEA